MELLQLCRVEEGNRPPLISERKWPQSGIFTALIFEARQMPDEANWEKEENERGIKLFSTRHVIGRSRRNASSWRRKTILNETMDEIK